MLAPELEEPDQPSFLDDIEDDIEEIALKGEWTEHENSCVTADGSSIEGNPTPSGNESVQMCSEECINNSECSGFEWYEEKWADLTSKCLLIN